MYCTVTNSARPNTLGFCAQAREPKVFESALLTNYKKDADIYENDVIKHYGLTESDFDFVSLKLKIQKEFLNSHYLFDTTKKTKIFLSEVIISSNHNANRYYAQVQNRVNTLNKVAKKMNLVPLFLTLTLPSRFHPQKQKSKYDKTLIDNPKFDGTSTRQASKYLTKMFKKLRDDRAYRGGKKIYFRVVEPHKDGTPHTHILLFVKKNRVEKMIDAFHRLYPSKTNKIETDIKSGASYIMKYINKTLPLSKQKNLSQSDKYLNAWYAKNRIVRFSSSRTLAPLKIYKLLHQKFDLYALTEAISNQKIQIITDDSDKIIKILSGSELLYTKNENLVIRIVGGNYLTDNLQTNDSALEVA